MRVFGAVQCERSLTRLRGRDLIACFAAAAGTVERFLETHQIERSIPTLGPHPEGDARILRQAQERAPQDDG
jgi:hypothetical protein